MPFVLLIVAITLLVSGVQNTQDQLFALIKGDFTAKPSFISWLVALLAIGFLGYIKPIEKVMRAFQLLVIVGLIISNRGVFVQFKKALQPYTNVNLGS